MLKVGCLFRRSAQIGIDISRSPLILFPEAALDKLDQRFERGLRFRSFGFDQDGVALARGEHHQAHDRSAADGVALARHMHLGGEARCAADELCRGARMQSLLVGDYHFGEMESRATLFLVIAELCHALVRRQDLTGHADIFASGFLRLGDGLLQRALAPDAGKLHQHRQIDTGDHLDIRPFHGRDGEVGRRAAEHVGEDHHALAGIDPGERRQHVAPPHVEIVVRPDRDRLDLLLRSDHVLKRGTEFVREPAMRDDDDADHVAPWVESAW